MSRDGVRHLGGAIRYDRISKATRRLTSADFRAMPSGRRRLAIMTSSRRKAASDPDGVQRPLSAVVRVVSLTNGRISCHRVTNFRYLAPCPSIQGWNWPHYHRTDEDCTRVRASEKPERTTIQIWRKFDDALEPLFCADDLPLRAFSHEGVRVSRQRPGYRLESRAPPAIGRQANDNPHDGDIRPAINGAEHWELADNACDSILPSSELQPN
ncbi:hypothetical protein LSH36_1497g00015 [Paralvinella palmiformis]|uniref:Uncharacterized protein n=1 Tax=Paralvinella palmiformis TaxID=53620 RepID=A0AAD9IT42_9ANNE|nr:hypothetical protein LSH36_1497g00015 [Paralvinella palmiformis]